MKTLIAIAVLMFAAHCPAATVIMIVDGKYYVGETKGGAPPTEWTLVTNVMVVDGDDTPQPPPPKDEIADAVDKHADFANPDPADPSRASTATVFEALIAAVKDESITIESSRDVMGTLQIVSIDKMPPADRAAWVVWYTWLAELLDELVSRGAYSLSTLESIYAGLVR